MQLQTDEAINRVGCGGVVRKAAERSVSQLLSDCRARGIPSGRRLVVGSLTDPGVKNKQSKYAPHALEGQCSDRSLEALRHFGLPDALSL